MGWDSFAAARSRLERFLPGLRPLQSARPLVFSVFTILERGLWIIFYDRIITFYSAPKAG